MQRLLIWILALFFGFMALGDAANACCAYEANESDSELLVLANAFENSAEVENPDLPSQPFSGDNCCCLCKVHNMCYPSLEEEPLLTSTYQDTHFYQDGDCRNANSPMWHPPKIS